MTLKALLERADYEDIWIVLKAEYNLEDIAYESFKHVYYELMQIEPEELQPPITLYIEKEKDEFSKTGYQTEVFGRCENSAEPLSLMMTLWSNWLSCHIDGNAVLLYGIYAVLAHILYEMTFFGYSSVTVYKKIKKTEVSWAKRPSALSK